MARPYPPWFSRRDRWVSRLARGLRPLIRPRPLPPPSTVRRVLLLKPCCLGDVLFATPLAAAIRAGYPDAELVWAVDPWARIVPARCPAVDRTLILAPSFPGRLRQLARERFDLAFCPDRSPLLGLLLALARIPHRVGLDSWDRGFAHTLRVPVPPGPIHEADLYLELARAADLPAVAPIPRIEAAPQDRRETADLALPPPPRVALHPGGGINPGMGFPEKRWPAERFARLGVLLWSRHRIPPILLGGPGDEEAVARVRWGLEGAQVPYVDLANRLSLAGLLGLYTRIDLLVGNDTGVLHLAAAVGTAVVALFGPTDPRVYGPRGRWVRALGGPRGEAFRHGHRPSPEEARRALAQIAVVDVLTAVEELLTARGRAGAPLPGEGG